MDMCMIDREKRYQRAMDLGEIFDVPSRKTRATVDCDDDGKRRNKRNKPELRCVVFEVTSCSHTTVK